MSKTKLPARARRSKTIYLRVTPSELTLVEAAVKKAGKYTVSQWLREVVMNSVDKCQTNANKRTT